MITKDDLEHFPVILIWETKHLFDQMKFSLELFREKIGNTLIIYHCGFLTKQSIMLEIIKKGLMASIVVPNIFKEFGLFLNDLDDISNSEELYYLLSHAKSIDGEKKIENVVLNERDINSILIQINFNAFQNLVIETEKKKIRAKKYLL